MNFYLFRYGTIGAYLEGRLHDRAKMARARQKLERFQQFLQRNSELLSVPRRVHRRLWTRRGTDKSSLFLCKNCWNRSSFCRARAIFALSCKRSLDLWTHSVRITEAELLIIGSKHQLWKVSIDSMIRVGDSQIKPSEAVRNS